MKTQTMETPTIPFWHKGPALGGGGTAGPCSERFPSGLWTDGDKLFIAVQTLNNGRFSTVYCAVGISCDEHFFELWDLSTGDTYDSCGPESWAYWARIPALPNV
jgi:hypothetical protein